MMKSILIFLIHAVYWALYLTVITTVTSLADPRSSLVLIGVIERMEAVS